MLDKDTFKQREFWLEEKYFHARDQELLEKIRRRQELKEAVGQANDEIIIHLEEMGWTRESVRDLLPLTPLVQVAWAEGYVSEKERKAILSLAEERGITEGKPSYAQLLAWLEERPSEEFFIQTLKIIGALLHLLPEKDRQVSRQDILKYCRRIAEASGDILGLWHHTTRREKETLGKIATALE